MRKMALALLGASCCLYAGSAQASDRFVDKNSPFPAPPYNTWDTAAHTIQTAISYAGTVDGDTVWVYGNSGSSIYTGYNVDPSHYSNVFVLTKNITLMGVANPIIDGQHETRGFYLSAGVVDGFTIRNGFANGIAGGTA